MMIMKNCIKIFRIVNLLIWIITFLFLFIQWNNIPNQIPLHYNLYGLIDNYGEKSILILVFILETIIFLLLNGMKWVIKLVITSSDSKKSLINHSFFIGECLVFLSNMSFSLLIYHMATLSNISPWLTFGPLILFILIVCFSIYQIETR